MAEGNGLIKKLAPYSMWIVVGGAILASSAPSVVRFVVGSGSGSSAPAQSNGPSNTAQQLLDEVAAVRAENAELMAQVRASSPAYFDARVNSEISADMTGAIASYRSHVNDFDTCSIKSFAGYIDYQINGLVSQTGKRYELHLRNRVKDLKDRHFASGQAHQGQVDWKSQDMADTVAGQSLEALALLHLIERRQQRLGPEVCTATIDASAFSKLESELFEMQVQGASLEDATSPTPLNTQPSGVALTEAEMQMGGQQ